MQVLISALLPCVLFLAPVASSAPSDSVETRIPLDIADMFAPRPGLKPVKSIVPGEESAAEDTLDTSDPRIKIILCKNGTWRYAKDWTVDTGSEIYSEAWETSKVRAYDTALSDLPYRVTIPLVDSASRFACPCQNKVFSRFGYRRHRRHQGVDLPLKTGTPVYCAFDGKVRVSMYSKGYGNVVIVRHDNGLETTYGHLSARNVKPGDRVSAGDVLGLGGSTGRSTGPHLHFETRYKGFAFDPQWIVDFENATLHHAVFVLKRKYLTDNSRYVPESEMEEDEIYMTEEQERAEADRIARELAAARYHKIRSGDTLSGLAVRYHTTVKAICKLNGITSSTTLNLGRTLRVK